ncbi:hypothetical protein DFH07DRAFT_948429 [Mycena maculata]|uniref:Uncharacterized protein n=1 Tax=Mycena maculata TaxID=230809 RepID=A0AAD7KIG0_9AGAR|nr:hypothetical protein DFH07DRAFT_948429 [Mycena maculata]
MTDADTRGQVLQDLAAWANVHNGDTLTVVAWQALGLLSDIEARKSKVLLLGLCRTPSSDPKTYYTLKEACVLSLSDLNQVFKNRRSVAHGNPGRILKENEKLRKSKDGAIGAVLVISVEQAEDDSRPVLEALGRTPVTWQPLGVFEEHRISFQKYGQFPEPLWKACLDNTLRGGIFAPTFHTS